MGGEKGSEGKTGEGVAKRRTSKGNTVSDKKQAKPAEEAAKSVADEGSLDDVWEKVKKATRKWSQSKKLPGQTSLRRQKSLAEQAATAFIFWLVFLSLVVVAVVAFVLVSVLLQGEKPPFLVMPPAVHDHFSTGFMVKITDSFNNPVKVFVYGEGPPAGETVVLLHGFGSSSFAYRKVVRSLAGKGLRAIAIDMPGVGLSDKPTSAPFDTSYFAESLGSIVTALALPPVHLVLHDTAGVVGAKWGAAKPAMVRSMTFLNTDFYQPYRTVLPSWLTKIPGATGAAGTYAWVMWLLLRSCCSRTVSLEDAEAYSYLLRRDGGIQVLKSMAQAVNGSEVHGGPFRQGLTINLVLVPKQLLSSNEHGEDWREEELVQHFSKHRPGVGSWPQEDAPDDVAKQITDFVQALPRTQRAPPEGEIVSEHVKEQLAAMGGKGHSHGHSHGGHQHGGGCSHGHGHGHGESHEHGHSQWHGDAQRDSGVGHAHAGHQGGWVM